MMTLKLNLNLNRLRATDWVEGWPFSAAQVFLRDYARQAHDRQQPVPSPARASEVVRPATWPSARSSLTHWPSATP